MFRRIVRKNEVRDAIFTDGQSEYGLMWVREDHPLLTTDMLYPASPQMWQLRTGLLRRSYELLEQADWLKAKAVGEDEAGVKTLALLLQYRKLLNYLFSLPEKYEAYSQALRANHHPSVFIHTALGQADPTAFNDFLPDNDTPLLTEEEYEQGIDWLLSGIQMAQMEMEKQAQAQQTQQAMLPTELINAEPKQRGQSRTSASFGLGVLKLFGDDKSATPYGGGRKR
jgi:hypothetical protein